MGAHTEFSGLLGYRGPEPGAIFAICTGEFLYVVVPPQMDKILASLVRGGSP